MNMFEKGEMVVDEGMYQIVGWYVVWMMNYSELKWSVQEEVWW